MISTITEVAECRTCEAVLFHVVGSSDHACNCGGRLVCGYAWCEAARPYQAKQELPTDCGTRFEHRVKGTESWRWADILNNGRA